MRIKNAIKILMENINLTYKAVFYRLICALIIVVVGYFAIYSALKPIFDSAELTNLLDAMVKVFTDFFTGRKVDTNLLPDAFVLFNNMLKANFVGLYASSFIFIILVFIMSVMFYMGDYSFGWLINNFMSCSSKFKFLPTFILNFNRAFLYALISSLVGLITLLLILLMSIVIIVTLMPFISVFAIIFAIIFLVVGLAFRSSLLSSFMAEMINTEKNVFKCLLASFGHIKKDFSQQLGTYAFVIMVIFYITITVLVFTFFTGLIISVPFMTLYCICLNLVDYYTINKKDYYLESDRIVRSSNA